MKKRMFKIGRLQMNTKENFVPQLQSMLNNSTDPSLVGFHHKVPWCLNPLKYLQKPHNIRNSSVEYAKTQVSLRNCKHLMI